MMNNTVSPYLRRHFKHFNAATLISAADSYKQVLDHGGLMFLAMAGAMSTAEIGISLATAIRKGLVHAISCTGANVEEDVMNLIAHDSYVQVPNYRYLTPAQEMDLFRRGLNRVTDVCIPEDAAFEKMEEVMLQEWVKADTRGERLFPHEFLYRALQSKELQACFQIDPGDSWVLAAMEMDIPIFVPGWEDSSLGNLFASHVIHGDIKNVHTVKTGVEYMLCLCSWYTNISRQHDIGFFQIGGGIAGDFPICVVPLLRDDMNVDVPLWSYFCQVSDSITSYGSYSGAVPNEKITWGKLGVEADKYIIESDATIVVPLLFALVMDE